MMEAFEEPVERIMEAIHSGCWERRPPELVADISTNGIVMTGGGSLVWGFDKLVTSPAPASRPMWPTTPSAAWPWAPARAWTP